MACARLPAALLLHINLLLAAYGGVALATGARLKWDASTYAPLRALLPLPYRAAAAALPAAGALQLALAHLALAAHFAAARAARVCYVLYCVVTAVLVCCEAAFFVWLWLAVAAWARSPQAAELAEALQLRDHVRPLLQYAARWHPLPAHLDHLVQEAAEDAPCNGYVMLALVALLALLQPAAVALAGYCAAHDAPAPQHARALVRTASVTNSWTSDDSERAPLRTAYKNGRLVIL